MQLRYLFLMTLLVQACGQPTDAPNVSTLRAEASSSYDADFKIALAAQESQAGGYFVAVSTAVSLTGAPRICVGNRDVCLKDEARSFPTTLVKQAERRIYQSEAPVKLAESLMLTVTAETETGEKIAGTYQLKSPVAESACHKAPDEFICEVEAHIARLTNEYRQRQGRSGLFHDQKMSYVSRLWSAEQARTGQISHAWFSNGRWRQEYVREFGTQPRLTAENVAMNSGSGNAAAVAGRFVNQWINSSGHRANMLSGHKTIGVGVAKRGNSWYATQNFGN